MPEPARLAVVGSLNLDLVTRVARLPGPGETLLAEGYRQSLGGKGANQAVSAARHSVDVAMIACVGDDPDGARLTCALAAEGVDITAVSRHSDGETHVAAPEVVAIDTTGAGDAFCGSLAAQLARGRALVDAVRDAVNVAALSTTRSGALEATPSRDEIQAALARRSVPSQHVQPQGSLG